ncbi:MAG: gluconate 2-dehydrogenase subunit 3 family protein [Actinomycetota bacterium]
MGDVDRTLRAVSEAIIPGPPGDEAFGAPEIRAEVFLEHYLETLIPGLSEGITTMLDGLAAEEVPGKGFADLSTADRVAVLQRLTSHELPDLRDLGDLLIVLSMAAVYGEWSGLDSNGELTRVPLGWELTGWPGPSEGERSLLRKRIKRP